MQLKRITEKILEYLNKNIIKQNQFHNVLYIVGAPLNDLINFFALPYLNPYKLIRKSGESRDITNPFQRTILQPQAVLLCSLNNNKITKIYFNRLTSKLIYWMFFDTLESSSTNKNQL